MKFTARLFCCTMLLVYPLFSGISSPADSTQLSRKPAHVMIGGDTLFMLQAQLAEFSAEERAGRISATLESLRAAASTDTVDVVDSAGVSYVMRGQNLIMTVTDLDAQLAGYKREDLARQYAALIREELATTHARQSPGGYADPLLKILGLVLGAALVFVLLRIIFPRLYRAMEGIEGRLFRPLRFKSKELLGPGALAGSLVLIARGLRFGVSVAVIYLLLRFVVDLLPWTTPWDIQTRLARGLPALLVIAAAVVIGRLGNRFFASLKASLPGWEGTVIRGLFFRKMEIVPARTIVAVLSTATRVLQTVFLIVLVYVSLTLTLSFFLLTETWAPALVDYVAQPVISVLLAVLGYLPNLLVILMVGVITYSILKFIRMLFGGLARGRVNLPGFHREWAVPTYKIVRFLALVLFAIIVFPYLPGSSSPAFQGISIFLGVLFSLGSSSAIANVIGGTVLTYMRPFHPGDRVRIADADGYVINKDLLVTRIRTIKNVDITIPNAMVLASHIINFSSSAREKGLILHTTVTIGYDVPWRKVHDLLLSAARKTPRIMPDRAPFILQTALDDFYVRYELNAYTDQSGKIEETYAALHESIQDAFFEAGVEICSPHFTAIRDGNAAAIPDQYLPSGYQPPAFHLYAPRKPKARK